MIVENKVIKLIKVFLRMRPENRGLVLQHIWPDEYSFFLGGRIDSEVSERFVLFTVFRPTREFFIHMETRATITGEGLKI